MSTSLDLKKLLLKHLETNSIPMVYGRDQIKRNLANQPLGFLGRFAGLGPYGEATDFVTKNQDKIYLFIGHHIGFMESFFFGTGKSSFIDRIPLEDFVKLKADSFNNKFSSFNSIGGKNIGTVIKRSDTEIIEAIKQIQAVFKTHLDEIRDAENAEKEKRRKEKAAIAAKKAVEQEKIFKEKKEKVLKSLDKKGDGAFNLVSSEDLSKLLQKHQQKIIGIDRTYIQQFVKISLYLRTKKQNIESILNSIRAVTNTTELNELNRLINSEIKTYELLLFHSLHMLISLVDDDMITFYEIHDAFDKLNIFNSNWENEVSNKLSDIHHELEGVRVDLQNISIRLGQLLRATQQMEERILSSLTNLTYMTQDSFKSLNSSLSSGLKSIESAVNMNTFVTGVVGYMNYQNTKILR